MKKIKIAIHKSENKINFCHKWIEYCNKNNINYKIVDCYKSDIIHQLIDCDALMWHFFQGEAKDFLFAKKLIASIEATGKQVFPNINSCWHFDDKVAQKYLLESIAAPLVDSYVFYSKKEAIKWVEETSYPKVFKLAGGASSSNVRLVKTKKNALYLVNRAFGKGFRQFNRYTLFKDTWTRFCANKSSIKDVIKSFLKIFIQSDYEKAKGRESGYIYFQDFLEKNEYDIRIIIIGNKAFAIKRMVRKNDFRASGSGSIIYDKNQIDINCIKIAFEVSEKLRSNCLTYDFIYDDKENPKIIEISYGFVPEPYYQCEGYWNSDLVWTEGYYIQPYWMVENIIKEIEKYD